MKRIVSIALVCALALSFAACGDKDDPQPQKTMINVRAIYWKNGGGGVTYPDVSSKVFVFYGKDFPKQGYTYKTGGTFVKGEERVAAEQTAVAGADGRVSINPKYVDQSLMVVIESAKFPSEDGISVFYRESLTQEEFLSFIQE